MTALTDNGVLFCGGGLMYFFPGSRAAAFAIVTTSCGGGMGCPYIHSLPPPPLDCCVGLVGAGHALDKREGGGGSNDPVFFSWTLLVC